jgi:hypothetical protein
LLAVPMRWAIGAPLVSRMTSAALPLASAFRRKTPTHAMTRQAAECPSADSPNIGIC